MKATIVIGLVCSAWLVLTGCTPQRENVEQPKQKEVVVDIYPQELMERIEKKDPIVLIDVRTKEELTGPLVALDNSIHIPLHELEARYSEIPKDKEVILICRSGNRSSRALFFLKQKGYQKVLSLHGGLMGLQKQRTK